MTALSSKTSHVINDIKDCLMPLAMILLLPFIGNSQNLVKSETVSLKSGKVYYEVYGNDGPPLFLLHGYASSSKDWSEYIQDYCEDFVVYVVDLPGHGRSDIFQEDWSLQSAGQNFLELLEHLSLDDVNAIGFSYGGDVLFQAASINPSSIKKMAVVGSIGSWNIDDYPDYSEYFSKSNLDNLLWMHDFQPDEAHINSLLDHFKNYKVYLDDEALGGVEAHLLIVLGDNDDSIPLSEVMRTRKSISNTDLWVLPDTGHGAHKGKNKDEFVQRSSSFLLE